MCLLTRSREQVRLRCGFRGHACYLFLSACCVVLHGEELREANKNKQGADANDAENLKTGSESRDANFTKTKKELSMTTIEQVNNECGIASQWGLLRDITPSFGARLVQERYRLHFLPDRAGLVGEWSEQEAAAL